MRILWRTAVLATLLANSCGGDKAMNSGDAGSKISFADSNLEEAVRQAIGKPEGDILAGDVAAAKRLDAVELGIRDLSGIEALDRLEVLLLLHNQLSDLAPLAKLTRLKTLSLAGNRLDGIDPLAKLTRLENLDLSDNQLSDLAPLAKLTRLEVLLLLHNQLSDLAPLAKLTRLRRLVLARNRLDEIGPLAKLTRLENLNLSANRIVEVEPLLENAGLGAGDQVNLRLNPLDGTALFFQIPQLEKRGVSVFF